MHKLISENYVSTKNQKGKKCLIVFLPEEVANSIDYELPKTIRTVSYTHLTLPTSNGV